MGVLTQGILGPVSGRVGPVVGGSWKGISYIRGYQQQVAQPNTAAQVAQKTRMSNVVVMAKLFLAQIIKPLNDRFAVHMSGYNLFVSRNIGEFDASGNPTWANLVFAQGTLTGVDTLGGSSADASAVVNITWVDNSGTGTAQATDEVYVAVMNETLFASAQSGGVGVRSDAAIAVNLDSPAAAGDNIGIYFSYRTANGFAVSNSEYLQITTV